VTAILTINISLSCTEFGLKRKLVHFVIQTKSEMTSFIGHHEESVYTPEVGENFLWPLSPV